MVAPFFLFWMLIFKLLVFDVAGDFAPAGATRGQWKQTKSAVAPLTPSQCALLFIDLYCCLGTNGTPTKFVSIKLNKLNWGREAVQRATAKPSGRLRRGEISASTRESSMKEKSTQSRERVKGGDFVPFILPCGVQRQRLWRLLLHKKRDVRTRTSPQNQKSSCAMSSPHWSLECALM